MGLPSEKQLAFAQILAAQHNISLPPEVLQDSSECSKWIDDNYIHKPPTEKQLRLAQDLSERLASRIPMRAKNSSKLLSYWIDRKKRKLETPPENTPRPSPVEPGMLTEKQLAVIDRHASPEIKSAVISGDIKAGRDFLKVHFAKLHFNSKNR